jgi:hypothetical protein
MTYTTTQTVSNRINKTDATDAAGDGIFYIFVVYI